MNWRHCCNELQGNFYNDDMVVMVFGTVGWVFSIVVMDV